ncbi:MAG: hypothetical protein RR048_03375, partial [Oscillospiraceae bacterium]
KQIFRGFLDKQVFDKNEKGAFLHIEARGVASYLIDNEAVPNAFYNVNLKRIFDKYIGGYNNFKNRISSRARAYEVFIGKGRSEWEAFCHGSLIITGKTPYMRGDRYIVCGYFDTKHIIEKNVLGMRQIYNPSKIISAVIMRDENGRYTRIYQNNHPESKGIYRKRYYIEPKEWENQKGLSAKEVFEKSLEDICLSEIILDGFFDYEVGDTVIFHGEELVIKEMTAEFSAGKVQTKILCCYINDFNK